MLVGDGPTTHAERAVFIPRVVHDWIDEKGQQLGMASVRRRG